MKTDKTNRAKCNICAHEKKEEIENAILRGKSNLSIAKDIIGDESKHDSIMRHSKECIPGAVANAYRIANEQKLIGAVVDVHQEFFELLQYAKKIRLASQEWLTDETGKINLNPRADEITVVYYDPNDTNTRGEPKKKTEDLQTLLERIEGKNISRPFASFRGADIRDLALKTIDRCDSLVDKFARLEGKYSQDKPNAEAIDRHLLAVVHGLIYQMYSIALSFNYQELIKPVIAEYGAFNVTTMTRAIVEFLQEGNQLPDAHAQAVLSIDANRGAEIEAKLKQTALTV